MRKSKFATVAVLAIVGTVALIAMSGAAAADVDIDVDDDRFSSDAHEGGEPRNSGDDVEVCAGNERQLATSDCVEIGGGSDIEPDPPDVVGDAVKGCVKGAVETGVATRDPRATAAGCVGGAVGEILNGLDD